MTLTTTENCAGITVGSDYYNFNNQSFTLEVTHNCSATYTVEVDLNSLGYTITPESLGLDTEALEDGIYKVLITVVQNDGTVVKESDCVFVNCTTACTLTETFLSTKPNDVLKSLAYHALVALDDCESCSCEAACQLFTAATSTSCGITPCSTTTTYGSTTSSCGCS